VQSATSAQLTDQEQEYITTAMAYCNGKTDLELANAKKHDAHLLDDDSQKLFDVFTALVARYSTDSANKIAAPDITLTHLDEIVRPSSTVATRDTDADVQQKTLDQKLKQFRQLLGGSVDVRIARTCVHATHADADASATVCAVAVDRLRTAIGRTCVCATWIFTNGVRSSTVIDGVAHWSSISTGGGATAPRLRW
jgi:hypothetical protein